MTTGKVYLVGAGPGDVGLITVKGMELLRHADCVIFDGLANAAFLTVVRADAETINVRKRSGDHLIKQSQINALLVEKAKQHKCVVRLKGGDPCLFGRASEEVRACIDAGIPFEIVPGITSGIAAAEYAGLFLTDRENASAVAFITGREAEDKNSSDIDWPSLAAFRGTLVFYMAMGTLADIAQRLISCGKDAQTRLPSSIRRRCRSSASSKAVSAISHNVAGNRKSPLRRSLSSVPARHPTPSSTGLCSGRFSANASSSPATPKATANSLLAGRLRCRSRLLLRIEVDNLSHTSLYSKRWPRSANTIGLFSPAQTVSRRHLKDWPQ
jgi:uroporphyrin-III C-methyltransferase